MPPKIRGMIPNSSHPQISQDQPRRFTLMLAGDDALELDQELALNDGPIRGLPHERFLLGQHVPIAPVLLLGQSTQAVDPYEVIACLQPVHLHATRDHLILLGQNQINLTETESLALLQAAQPLIEEDFQHPLLFKGQYDWFIPAGPFSSLASYSVEQAQGRNIDWWMPRDTHEEGIARRWRKLQNEIQMLWHISPVNEQREQQGLPSINSLWVSGIGKLSDVNAPKALRQSSQVCGFHPLLPGLAKLLNIPYSQEVNTENLHGAFAFLNHPEDFWPQLLSGLENKTLDEILIIDFPQGKLRERLFAAKDLYKKSWAFWNNAQALTWADIVR